MDLEDVSGTISDIDKLILSIQPRGGGSQQLSMCCVDAAMALWNWLSQIFINVLWSLESIFSLCRCKLGFYYLHHFKKL